jgi:large subunit ribosomal protein L30
VSDKTQRTVRIKWVRSGIGFSHQQKRIVRSLGLKKLNQEVERPDTPQIRGLVAKVPHLLKIVEAASKPAWTLVPEYTIYPPKATPAKPAEMTRAAPEEEVEKTEPPVAPPHSPLPSRAGVAGVGAAGEPTAAPAVSKRRRGLRAAPTSADASGAESVSADEEASPKEGQPEA